MSKVRIAVFVDQVASSDPDSPEPDDGRPKPVLLCMADVEPCPVYWLWPGRIPRGKVTIISGDPGLGKSFVTLGVAVTVSTGAGWPDDPAYRTEPGDVLLLSAEDDPADTIRPRLDALDVRVDRIHVLTTVKQADGSLTPFSLTCDLSRLDHALLGLRSPKLVIIDPVSCYLGDTDDHKNGAIR